MENKKEVFKLLIKEFHEMKLPQIIKREYQLPDHCTALAPESSPDSPVVSSRGLSVTAVTGPRRCGKTYFLYQLIDHFCSGSVSPVPRHRLFYINFEDDRLLPLSSADLAALPDAYYELYPDNRDREVMIFLDEIHQVEGWQLFLRRLLEHENVRLFVTGSSSRFCPRTLSSALACHIFEFSMSPLTFKEFLNFNGLTVTRDFAYSNIRFKIKNLLEEYIIYGGFPEVTLAEPSLKLKILKEYYDILIYKDLVEQFAVRNITLLKGLLKHLITHVGSAVSINSYFLNIQPNLHVSRETVLDYVSHLEKKGLISLIRIFSDSSKVQQVNPKKVYSMDNGINNAVSFPVPHLGQKLAKNLVFQNLKRAGHEVFYWKSRKEVDFVARQNGKLQAINVSYGKELGGEEADSLMEFQYSIGKRDAKMTIITKDTEKEVADVAYIPLWKWLLTLA